MRPKMVKSDTHSQQMSFSGLACPRASVPRGPRTHVSTNSGLAELPTPPPAATRAQRPDQCGTRSGARRNGGWAAAWYRRSRRVCAGTGSRTGTPRCPVSDWASLPSARPWADRHRDRALARQPAVLRCKGDTAAQRPYPPGRIRRSLPRYITATQSAMCRTSARSCQINISPICACDSRLAEQVDDRGLHRDVERGNRLVGDDAGPDCRRARARWRRAAAGRPRAGAACATATSAGSRTRSSRLHALRLSPGASSARAADFSGRSNAKLDRMTSG